ncbi:MAG TPA: endo-1,4-beta-glucanase [Blastocatellia bacterium]|nr:endo-1,4-beta-glucanase [Blastocatellia bacterium]
MSLSVSRYVSHLFSGTRAVTMAMFLIAAMALATITTAWAQNTCNAFGTIDMGKYWINNNTWGQSSGTGWECIWSWGSASSSWGWGTSWSWANSPSSVKAYPSVVLGWHWGWRRSGTGLPVQLSANRNVNSGWNYTVRQTGTNVMNVAYDLWFHPISNPGSSNNPSDELMIWLYRSGGAGPAGTYQATVNLAGTSWDLYRGFIGSGSSGWNVYSFVRRSNTTSATMNLRDFTNHIVSRGWMSNSKYLTSVQAGSEIFTGTGQLDVNSYYCNVQ